MPSKNFTSTRIRVLYLAKLRRLAKLNRRSMANMLEVLIDREEKV
jgi:hypothetical protein